MALTVPPTAPVATIIVPTRNRGDLLLQAVESALTQDVPVQVIVVDEASSDGSPQRLAERFPQVRVVRREVPGGPVVARNQAAQLAVAPHLVTLDDDCVFTSRATVRQTLALFDHPRVAAVTVPFVNVRQDDVVRTRAPGAGRWLTDDFFGGMVAFDRAAYLAVGGHREMFFIQGEESDIALRLYDRGYVVRLGTADPIAHHASPIRDAGMVDRTGPRNQVWFVLLNVPLPWALPHLAMLVVNYVRFGLRRGRLGSVLRGLGQGLAGWRRCWSLRRPVRLSVYRLTRRLKHQGPMELEAVEALLPPLSPRA